MDALLTGDGFFTVLHRSRMPLNANGGRSIGLSRAWSEPSFSSLKKFSPRLLSAWLLKTIYRAGIAATDSHFVEALVRSRRGPPLRIGCAGPVALRKGEECSSSHQGSVGDAKGATSVTDRGRAPLSPLVTAIEAAESLVLRIATRVAGL